MVKELACTFFSHSANYDELKAKYDLLLEQHETYCDRVTVCSNYKAAYEIESRRRQELAK